MRNVQIIVEYDGSAYCGWQRQQNGTTVQQCLEEALFRLTGEAIRLTAAGRTDAGVHACAQSANFFTQCTIPTRRMPYALNSVLPEDIVVTAAYERAETFSSRFSAREKTYVYKILNRPLPSALQRKYVYFYPMLLDIEKMRRAARHFIGEHDFVAFMATGSQSKTTVRQLYTLQVEKKEDLIEITVCGNGFLYNMVRIIAGTLLYVGNGKIEPEVVKSIIARKDRTLAGATLPPQGLYLKEVVYDDAILKEKD